jgi:DNA polymerase V
MIGLLDANNFYASCERVFRPDLENRPLVVLSNNDGCIIARSAEVKALGIPMGAPYFKFKKILEDNNVGVFSSNYTLYGDMSGRMMILLHTLVPKVEVYSIDEAFLDFSGIDDTEPMAQIIRQKISKNLGIPTSLGISTTKTLAKVANWLAKKQSGYNGVCVLDKQQEIDKALQDMNARDIWGIGRRLSDHLAGAGIHTALQLKRTDPRWMRRTFTVVGERLVQELNGVSCLPWEDRQEPKQSTQVTRSFATPVTDFAELRSIMATYATRLGEKIRSQKLVTRSLIVSLSTNKHKINTPYYTNFATISLPCAVEDNFNLIKASATALKSIFKAGYAYSKAGVMAIDLHPRDQNTQQNLFTDLPTQNLKTSRLFSALDRINSRYGKGTLFSAACGNSLRWKDQKAFISPAYTTLWKDIPLVYTK